MAIAISRKISRMFLSMPGSFCGLLYSGMGYALEARKMRMFVRQECRTHTGIGRHRVVSAVHEGMATQQAADSQHQSANCAVTVHRFQRVFRTGWRVAAGGKKKWRDDALVGTKQGDQHGGRNTGDSQGRVFSFCLACSCCKVFSMTTNALAVWFRISVTCAMYCVGLG